MCMSTGSGIERGCGGGCWLVVEEGGKGGDMYE